MNQDNVSSQNASKGLGNTQQYYVSTHIFPIDQFEDEFGQHSLYFVPMKENDI